MTPPRLITLDVFGTVLDWRRGLADACDAAGRPLGPGEFDAIVDRQAELEAAAWAPYAAITARSLVEVIGLTADAAERIGGSVGTWPAYADSAGALERMMRAVPCAAMSNSDRVHGEQVQAQLGFRLSDWLCAEDTRRYKPDPAFWHAMAARRGIEPGPDWWHVSAYADYDLDVAARLGLTTVFVARLHARPGPATHTVADLAALAEHVARGVAPFELQPRLLGDTLELRPLAPGDFEPLYAAASDPLIWEQHPEPTRHERDVFRRYFDGGIASGGAFAIVERATGRTIGSSRYCNLRPGEVEIGWTFLERAYWGGATNRELKRLMIAHALRFVPRVVFVVGERNTRSRRALEKLGARFAGHLDAGGREPDGARVVYEIAHVPR